jgi:hypothetical protein
MMTWQEAICLTMGQNADDVACIAALLGILHQKLVLPTSGTLKSRSPISTAP